jgi:hypothetical protein
MFRNGFITTFVSKIKAVTPSMHSGAIRGTSLALILTTGGYSDKTVPSIHFFIENFKPFGGLDAQ